MIRLRGSEHTQKNDWPWVVEKQYFFNILFISFNIMTCHLHINLCFRQISNCY